MQTILYMLLAFLKLQYGSHDSLSSAANGVCMFNTVPDKDTNMCDIEFGWTGWGPWYIYWYGHSVFFADPYN